MVKKLIIILSLTALLGGGYYLVRLMPLLSMDNEGAETVVLLHGLGRSESAMLLLESSLKAAGFAVHNLGYPSMEATPEALVALVGEQIQACCSSGTGTIHFVGHSLGGLLIRAYLERQRPRNLGRVVLIGTPNKGSELADMDAAALVDVLLDWAGPAARALGTGPAGFPASLSAPDYPVGVIAGTKSNAIGNEWLPQPNDGLVSVESTRLAGMAAFVSFELTHWGLRNDRRVATQVVTFLQNGEFSAPDSP
jgi:triacylglycerol lipase